MAWRGGAHALVLSLVLAGMAVHAQGSAMQSWQADHDRARQAFAAGDLAAAEQAARAALRQARAGQGETLSFVASSLNVLALVRQRQGRVADAVDLLKEALALSEQAKDTAATAALALNLGNAFDALGRGDEALLAWQRSASTAQALAADAPVRAQALSALARAHAARGETALAARYDQGLLEARHALDPALQVEALERETRIAVEQGRFAEARAALEQALLLLEPAAPQSVALAGHLNELGLWQWQRREYASAALSLERALAIVAAQDANSLETARITANLAQLHEARGDAGQAKALYARAMAIYTRHGDVPEALLGQAQAFNFLAGQDYRQRRLAQAEQGFLRALALTEQAAGEQSPRLLPLLDNLTTLYRSQQREGQARAHAERAERLRE